MTKSEQARADALADAETLRKIVTDLVGPTRNRISGLLRLAWLNGYNVEMRMTEESAIYATDSARAAARAAFRAVPGLRG